MIKLIFNDSWRLKKHVEIYTFAPFFEQGFDIRYSMFEIFRA